MNRIESKYYFIYYNCKIWGWKPGSEEDWVSTGCVDLNHQSVIDIHPIQWQIDCNNKWGKERIEHGHKTREHYEIINWQRLTLEEYREFKGKIG